eukprot:GEZU01020684.1.p1 GENE.GEZU01020684.1~~GEZU01020684.1.p1  ORF type:complete len:686 (-),score=265.87 GEZU01020684.1:117-2174(-)
MDKPFDVPLAAICVSLCSGFLAMFVMFFLTLKVLKSPVGIREPGGARMYAISNEIKIGANAFLKSEYKILAVFVVIVAAALFGVDYWGRTTACFLVGAITSSITGYIGMSIAVRANVRTTHAARRSLNGALRVAFNAGTVMGLSVVGLGLLALCFSYLGVRNLVSLAGFGFGASSIALFARVGGGIYTKAADVGADLVGKIEMEIPEDDARNPATIADNVGDNVGDVAGMGADLFSSFVGSNIASSLLGISKGLGPRGVAYPLWISATGIVCSIIGMALVRCRDSANSAGVLAAFRRGLFITNILQIGAMAGITAILEMNWKLFGTMIIGLVAGHLIAITSEIFTSPTYYPTRSISRSGLAGPASVIIQGLSVGMMSTIAPALIIASTLLASIALSGSYGIALASTGLISCLGFTLATDAYGPVADNAGGIAEMSQLEPEVRERTDILDALGNTTAAVGKGFAVGSAVLTGFSLLSVFKTRVGLNFVDSISDMYAIAGIVVGAMIPFFFSALTMGAVSKAAQMVVYEVRRQFKERPGIMARTEKPDYAGTVRIVTAASLHSMLFPAALTLLTPIIFGIAFPPQFLASLLLGNIVCGFMLSMMMASSGGAWDNAKKYIEAKRLVDKETGEVHAKGSDAHKAAVVGDTVGDPFKDTSGPALNILIKLMSIIALVIAPAITKIYGENQ